jgi:hypothetical protein
MENDFSCPISLFLRELLESWQLILILIYQKILLENLESSRRVLVNELELENLQANNLDLQRSKRTYIFLNEII